MNENDKINSSTIKNDIKIFKKYIKQQENQNIYQLIDNVKTIIEVYYNIEDSSQIKRKLIKEMWNCDSILEYILFLENKLNETLLRLKFAEEGFDKRNIKFNLPRK